MSNSTPQDTAPALPTYSPMAGFLSYLVPGLGQISQGRIAKGVLFFVCLYGMFFGGMALGGWNNVYIVKNAKVGDDWANNPWHVNHRGLANLINRMHYLGQFWIGVAAWPAVWQYNGWPLPSFLRDFQRAPETAEDDERMGQVLAKSDKTPDVAWVYTVIAGVLNILVIYDAFAGPAYVRRPSAAQDKSPQHSEAVASSSPPEAVSL
jgi:hypothetical protein